MDRQVFEDVLKDVEKSVIDFRADDWKNRPLFDRFEEAFRMVEGYDLPEEQKMYVFRKNVILLVVEAVHNIFPATEFFRENPEERFLVLRTPGQEKNEEIIDDWTEVERKNWEDKERSTAGGGWWS